MEEWSPSLSFWDRAREYQGPYSRSLYSLIERAHAQNLQIVVKDVVLWAFFPKCFFASQCLRLVFAGCSSRPALSASWTRRARRWSEYEYAPAIVLGGVVGYNSLSLQTAMLIVLAFFCWGLHCCFGGLEGNINAKHDDAHVEAT